MKKCIAILLLFIVLQSRAQQLYFPPIAGNTWDTMSPTTLGWCQPGIDSLYNYLEQTHTSAFMILKDGKIVLEKYFGTFTADSVHYWASAGKSLVGFMVGMAQEKGLLNIGSPVSNYLGSGWTVAPTAKESQISVRNLVTMTSGLDEKPALPCENESTSAVCLQYLTDTGQRWAYHTGAYQQLAAVLSKTSGQTINNFTSTNVGNRIGMTGLWVNGVYFSKTRSMARFGLLALNKGVWQTDTLLNDKNYFTAMTNTSQVYNPAYGYLWWLNGKSSFLSPGLQYVFQGSLIPSAPADMFCALGKNDQKIYVVPSQNLVVIRTGESSYGAPVAFSPFDNLLWGKIDSLGYQCSYRFTGNGNWSNAANWEGQRVPPRRLQNAGIIIINPAVGGQCILDVAQTVATSSSLIISANAQFIVAGKLDVLQQ